MRHLWYSGLILFLLLSVFLIQKPILLILLLFGAIFFLYTVQIDFQYRDIHLVGLAFFSAIALPPISALPGMPNVRVEELIIFLILPLFFFFRNRRIEDRYLKYFLYSLIGFAAAIVFSLNYGKYFLGVPTSLNDYFEVLKVIKFFIAVLIISRLNLNKEDLYKLLYVIVFSFVISAVIGIMQFYGILGFERITAPYYAMERIYDIHNRMMGTFFNPNTYGTALTIGVVIVVALSYYEKNFGRKTGLIAIAVILSFTVALTQSRTAVVVLLLAVILLTALNFIKKQFTVKQLLIIIGVFTVLLLAIVSLLADQILTRFMGLGEIGEDLSWQMRLLAWYLNLTIFSESMVFGWGPAKLIHTTIVDSEYILILRRYGIVGFLIYILIYFIPLIRAFVMQKLKGIRELMGQIIFTATFVFLISNITNPLFHEIQYMGLWAMLIGIFFALPLKEDSRKSLNSG